MAELHRGSTHMKCRKKTMPAGKAGEFEIEMGEVKTK